LVEYKRRKYAKYTKSIAYREELPKCLEYGVRTADGRRSFAGADAAGAQDAADVLGDGEESEGGGCGEFGGDFDGIEEMD
jgi:hypothetical protein